MNILSVVGASKHMQLNHICRIIWYDSPFPFTSALEGLRLSVKDWLLVCYFLMWMRSVPSVSQGQVCVVGMTGFWVLSLSNVFGLISWVWYLSLSSGYVLSVLLVLILDLWSRLNMELCGIGV